MQEMVFSTALPILKNIVQDIVKKRSRTSFQEQLALTDMGAMLQDRHIEVVLWVGEGLEGERSISLNKA